MFFYALHKSSLWKKISKKNRNIRIFITGSIIYIIIHSYLYSKYINEYKFINNYRKYIYFLILVDLILTFIGLKTNNKKRKLIKNPHYKQNMINIKSTNKLTNIVPKKENQIDTEIPVYISNKSNSN